MGKKLTEMYPIEQRYDSGRASSPGRATSPAGERMSSSKPAEKIS